MLTVMRRGDAHAYLGCLHEHLGAVSEARRQLGLSEAAYRESGDAARAEDMRRHLKTLK